MPLTIFCKRLVSHEISTVVLLKKKNPLGKFEHAELITVKQASFL